VKAGQNYAAMRANDFAGKRKRDSNWCVGIGISSHLSQGLHVFDGRRNPRDLRVVDQQSPQFLQHRKILVEHSDGIVIDTEICEVREKEQRSRQICDVIVLQAKGLHVKTHGDGLGNGADRIETRIKMMKILQRTELFWQVRERVI